MKKILLLIFFFSVISLAYTQEQGQHEPIPFDFPNLVREDVGERYHRYGYFDRKNPYFKFEIVFPKNWMMIVVKEPDEIPEYGGPVEIGAFHRYRVPADSSSDILAGMYVLVTRVPSEWSDDEAIEKFVENTYKKLGLKILKIKKYELPNKTLEDILFSYKDSQGRAWWSRVTGFKVLDKTREYLFGKKDLFYILQLNSSEENYRSFAAEVFFVGKLSLRLVPDK
ncbi:MAG: hypothetical protein JSW40_09820 [Candidatus Omnitrophota bacterium]|nr:MAG: hypothetical protein JSW40_09820 [Candidatus Omnitrophota bacterium]